MSAASRTGTVFAGVASVLVACGGAPVAPSPAPTSAPSAARAPFPPEVERMVPRAELVRDAVARVREGGQGRPVRVHLRRTGPNASPDVAAADAELARSLFADGSVVSSRVIQEPGPPVADTSTGTGHVNTVTMRYDPQADLVLLTGAWRGGVAVIASRPRGPGDPQDPSDVLWVLVGKGP